MDQFSNDEEFFAEFGAPRSFVEEEADKTKDEEQFRKKLLDVQKERNRRDARKERSLGQLDRFKFGFDKAFGEGREVHRESFQDARRVRGQDIESPRISQTLGTNPTFTRMRDTLGISNKLDRQSRIDKGIGLRETLAGRTGQFFGTLGNDIVQDRTRGLWWLLNAPQAIVSVSQEGMLNKYAPSLYKADFVSQTDKDFGDFSKAHNKGNGWNIPTQGAEARKYLIENNYGSISQDGDFTWKDGYSEKLGPDGRKYVTKRRYRPGMVDTLLAPTALSVNAGLGLLNPVGGNQGYEAVLPSKEDPTKTSNAVLEIGAKYILGRTGNLLNWNEFKEARPDVSKDEYMRYKAFKWDKGMDINPFDDGNFTVPTGVLKGTADGIHGPEIQFLGRSIPLATTIMPTIATAIGTAAGAAWDPKDLRNLQEEDGWIRDKKSGELRSRKKEDLKPGKTDYMTDLQKRKYRSINRVRNGLVSGMGSLLGSSVIGNMIEGERRRRNAVENELKGGNAEQYLGN